MHQDSEVIRDLRSAVDQLATTADVSRLIALAILLDGKHNTPDLTFSYESFEGKQAYIEFLTVIYHSFSVS